MKTIISLLLILGFVFLPVAGAGELNPSVESQPFICRISYTKWICTMFGGGSGAPGPVGAIGPPGAGNITTINFYNFTGDNLTTISNTTYFYSEMNQSANMTAGPEGPAGAANMTAGPEGPAGAANMTAGPAGAANMTAGPQGPAGSSNFTAGTSIINRSISTDSGYTIEIFNGTSGNWIVPANVTTISVLVVGGGGSGGAQYGGGGGAGGIVYSASFATVPGMSIPYVAGAGGTSKPGSSIADGNDGSASSFNTTLIAGGGAGGGGAGTGRAGVASGSGGGGGGLPANVNLWTTGGVGKWSGGRGNRTSFGGGGGGGGGNSTVGEDSGVDGDGYGGDGGDGTLNSISGSSVYYAAGGGGFGWNGGRGNGGSGIGGQGAYGLAGTDATSGQDGTGSGGGGTGNAGTTGAGGSGTVILKYTTTVIITQATIAHGLGTDPAAVLVTPSLINQFASVTAKNATHFTVDIAFGNSTPGTNQSFYWGAFK